MVEQWFIKMMAHHFKVAQGLFWLQKVYKYSLRVATLELGPSLLNPRPVCFPLQQGKLPDGESWKDRLKIIQNPHSTSVLGRVVCGSFS